ncbi:ferredoxin [Kitasatospora sp. NPDC127059]|uniref:ferredoxin n=1 Tax=unclassified Kitasatospora TaxID=2633591 RepID=UPI0036568A07
MTAYPAPAEPGSAGQAPDGPGSPDHPHHPTGKDTPVRIVVDRDVCIGAGQCVLTEPRVFQQNDEDGMVELRTDRPDTGTAETVLTAVTLCPSRALSIEA